MRLNSATLSWQLTLNGPLPSGRRRWEAGSQAPEPQPGVPPSVAGSPGWREKVGAQSGGLSPELEPTWAHCLLHTAPLGQDQGGTETCPQTLGCLDFGAMSVSGIKITSRHSSRYACPFCRRGTAGSHGGYPYNALKRCQLGAYYTE